jgi:predicted ATPase/DNA-binding CsgD family transcriptional regulator
VTNEDLVEHALANAFGIREEFNKPMLETLATHLQAREVLLVVDNCEHVLSGSADAVQHLLKQCPGLKVLATSREPLGIAGEKTWVVPSLAETTGVTLFIERAQEGRSDFAAETESQRALIIDIVTRLDGIPLAIELAAARVRVMSLQQIAQQITDRFRLLSGGPRGNAERQQTMEASVAWSYDLLDETEQVLARRLSLLNGFSLSAAESIASDSSLDSAAVLDVLARLFDKSMVQADHSQPEVRYRFLETVRQFLQQRLVESGELDATRQRHLEYFVQAAEAIAPVISFEDSPRLLSELGVDHGNLENALEYADSTDQLEMALRLAAALTLFWELRGHLGRGGRWFARLLDRHAATTTSPSANRARSCWGAAHIALYGDDFATMSTRAPEALELAEALGDDWVKARALNIIGFATAMFTPAEARPGLRQSIELGEKAGDQWSVVDSWKMTTVSYYIEHDEAGATESMVALKMHATKLKARYFLAWHQGLTGFFLAHRGQFAEARVALQTSIETCNLIGEPITGGLSRVWLSAVDIAEGNLAQAHADMTLLLQRAQVTGESLAIPDLMANLGEIALAQDDAAGAVALLEPYVQEIHSVTPPYFVARPALALAAAYRHCGNLASNEATLGQLQTSIAEMGNPWLLALIDVERALMSIDTADLDEAESSIHRALTIFVRLEQQPNVPTCLEALGAIAARAQSFAEATRCLAAAAELRSQLGLVAFPVEERKTNALVVQIREAVGDESFEQDWAGGAALTFDEVIEYVSRARGERKRPQSGWASLTPTELKVVELATQGMTNPQIAEKMFIARGTVQVHLSNIFAKVAVTSRSELAAMSARR